MPTYEVTDIFEGGYPCVGKKPFLDDVLARNIKYVLKKHGKWKNNYHIIFPAGGIFEFLSDSQTYTVEFAVYRGKEIVYHGVAYGSFYEYTDKYEKTGDECDIYYELVDMTVEVKKPYGLPSKI